MNKFLCVIGLDPIIWMLSGDQKDTDRFAAIVSHMYTGISSSGWHDGSREKIFKAPENMKRNGVVARLAGLPGVQVSDDRLFPISDEEYEEDIHRIEKAKKLVEQYMVNCDLLTLKGKELVEIAKNIEPATKYDLAIQLLISSSMFYEHLQRDYPADLPPVVMLIEDMSNRQIIVPTAKRFMTSLDCFLSARQLKKWRKMTKNAAEADWICLRTNR